MKTVPFTPLSHPFVERPIGTILGEYPDPTLFWNTKDLERKMENFRQYYNRDRVHQLRDGDTEVSRLQAEGHKVVFVGGGINDAPALAGAGVGIVNDTGTDIALKAGDLVLVSGDLHGIVLAVALSRKTLRTIRGNFFWACAYNVALIPLAAGARDGVKALGRGRQGHTQVRCT